MSNFISKFKFKQYKIIFLVIIFFLAIGIWYSPIIFKGYPAQLISGDILLARNYQETGVLATQDNQNVVISSNLVEEQGHPLVMSQYLRSFFYAKVFDIVGIPNYNNLILLSIILYALALVLFTILILYLFNFKIAVIFSLIYIFSPIGWGLVYFLGGYEFCLIFWALFFIFYFLGLKKTKQSQNKFYNIFFVISGISLILSALSREVTFVFALAFFVFLVVKKLKWQLIYIFIPFVILLAIFWFPSVLSGENRYLSLFSHKAPEKSIFSAYAHVFPDPYTYYFEKEEFLEEFKNQKLGWIEDLQIKKDLTNYGFTKISLLERARVGFYILSQHIFRFFSLEDFGGPFIFLLLILGLIYLRNKYKFLYQLSLYWLGISFFVFAFVILVSRNHLMDFIWVFILLISLGLIYLFQVIKDYFKLGKGKSIFFEIVIISLVLYHLVLADHVILSERYDKDFTPRNIAYAQEIKKLGIGDEEVIAIPEDSSAQSITLNYLTNKSFVVFKSSTLDKLLKEGKIKQALEAFNVKYILGYSDELSDEVITETGVANITSNSLEIDMKEVSENKSFFMNLVR